MSPNRQALAPWLAPAGVGSGRSFKRSLILDGRVALADWSRSGSPARLPVVTRYTLDEGAFSADLFDPLAGKLVTPAPTGTDAAPTRPSGRCRTSSWR